MRTRGRVSAKGAPLNIRVDRKISLKGQMRSYRGYVPPWEKNWHKLQRPIRNLLESKGKAGENSNQCRKPEKKSLLNSNAKRSLNTG